MAIPVLQGPTAGATMLTHEVATPKTRWSPQETDETAHCYGNYHEMNYVTKKQCDSV